jgi:membrane protease YdiL (CAAX protease family)
MPRAVVALLAGPFISGLLMTGLVHGRAGFRDLLLRLGVRPSDLGYSAALLFALPLAMLALPPAAAAIWPRFLPRILTEASKAPVFALAVGAGLSAGFFEETAWTGFAAPVFLRRRGVLATGLAMGFLWGAWHLIVNLWSSGDVSGPVGAVWPLLVAVPFWAAAAVLSRDRSLSSPSKEAS